MFEWEKQENQTSSGRIGEPAAKKRKRHRAAEPQPRGRIDKII
jgi:hypothetical protein